MKKSLYFLIPAAAMTVLATGCKVDLDIEQTTEPEAIVTPLVPMTFQAGGEATKSAIDGTSILWASGDAITVFGSDNNPYPSGELTSGGDSATFSVELPEGTTDPYAVYPANAAASINGSTITTTIPSEQVLADGTTVAPGALVAVAKASGHKFAFKNAFSLVVVTPAIDGVTEISVSAASGSLAGDFAITVSDQPAAYPAGNNVSTVTLKPYGGGTFTKGTAYYVAVAPGAVSDLTIRFKTADVSDKAFKLGRIASGKLTLERNAGIELTSSPVVIIDSKAALDDWAAFSDRNSYAAALYTDIDYEGSNWTPVDFENDFNGLGHKIYNIKIDNSSTTNVGFFGRFGTSSATRSVKNLVLGSSDSQAEDVSQITISSNSETHYVGSVIAKKGGALTLDNVESWIPISVGSDFSSTAYVAGIIADNTTVGVLTMKSCTNHGDITINANSTSQCLYGGLIAYGNKTANVSNCENYGDIKLSANAKSPCLGGLAGSAANATFEACKNYGVISAVGTLTTAINMGGLVGQSGTNFYLKGCVNEGSVYCKGTGGSQRVGGLLGCPYSTNQTMAIQDLDGSLSINKGTVTIEAGDDEITTSTTSQFFVAAGGIVGYLPNSANETIQNARNDGDINATAKVKSTLNSLNYITLQAGGIAGRVDGFKTFSNCENTASVSVYNAASALAFAFSGGIIGHTFTGSDNSISSCTNRGNVTVNSNTHNNTTVAAGGIVGFSYMNVDNCSNYGNISNTAKAGASDGAHYAGAIVGVTRTIDSSHLTAITNSTVSKNGLVNGTVPTKAVAVHYGESGRSGTESNTNFVD